MKNIILILWVTISLGKICFAQSDTIKIQFKYSELIPADTVSYKKLTNAQRDSLLKDTSSKALLIVTDSASKAYQGWKIGSNQGVTQDSLIIFDVTAEIKNHLENDDKTFLKIKKDTTTFGIIKITWNKIKNNSDNNNAESVDPVLKFISNKNPGFIENQLYKFGDTLNIFFGQPLK